MELAGYLDDWAYARRGAKRAEADWRRLVAAARAADPDPWRDALRATVGTRVAEAVAEFRRLADDAKALDAQPVPSLIMLALQLKNDAGDCERAARVLRRTVSRHPADFWAHYELSTVHGAGAGQLSEMFPRPDEAVRHLTAAVAIRPGSAIAHNSLGNALQAQGKHDEALAEFREAIRLEPDYAGAHFNLDIALQAQGKLGEAIAEYREAIRLKPDHAKADSNLGATVQAQGKLDEAIGAYREAVRLEPDDAVDRSNLGNALWAQGSLNEAIAAFHEALRLQPDFATAHNNLANSLAMHPDPAKRDPAEALEHARKATGSQPRNGTFVNTLATAQYRAGLRDEAMASYRKSMELRQGGDPYDWFFLAMIEHERGNAQEAARWFDKSIAWMKQQKVQDADLLQAWTEAAKLLGRPGPEAPNQKPAPHPK